MWFISIFSVRHFLSLRGGGGGGWGARGALLNNATAPQGGAVGRARPARLSSYACLALDSLQSLADIIEVSDVLADEVKACVHMLLKCVKVIFGSEGIKPFLYGIKPLLYGIKPFLYGIKTL